jgi:hypothetical protein
MLATFAAPAPVGPGGLAVRDAAMGDALTARTIQVEAREEGDIEGREAKKGKKGKGSLIFQKFEAPKALTSRFRQRKGFVYSHKSFTAFEMLTSCRQGQKRSKASSKLMSLKKLDVSWEPRQQRRVKDNDEFPC